MISEILKLRKHSSASAGKRVRGSPDLSFHKSWYLKKSAGALTAHARNLRSLLHLRMLQRNKLPQKLLSHFHSCTSERILTPGCTVWYFSCTAAERKNLQQVVNTARSTFSSSLLHLSDTFRAFLRSRLPISLRTPLLFWALPVRHPPIRVEWNLSQPEQSDWAASSRKHKPHKQVCNT